MKNVFIDTNIYLTFYHFTSDDLEELKKLLVAIRNKSIRLYTTEQVINEFQRNREARIKDALYRFTSQRMPNQFPQICKSYEEYGELRKLIREFEEKKSTLLEQLKRDIEGKCCKADEVMKDLIKVSEVLNIDDDILGRSRNRCELGNPPGKKDSLGDAVNWELLLENVPEGEDVYLVTDDTDYVSKIDKDKLAEYLKAEWEENKKARIFYYHRLSEFFKEQFADIKLASELDKELNIGRLIASPNFATTHLAIQKLSEYTDFTDSQVEQIIEASTTNDQISWINEDADVREFLLSVISGREDIIEPDVLAEFISIFE